MGILLNSVFVVSAMSDGQVKNVLKKSLFEYFDKGKDSTLTLDETKDLLVFYLESEHDVEIVDLSKVGENTQQSVHAIISKALIGYEEKEEEPGETCDALHKCKTDFHKAYKNEDCSWSNVNFCEYGCENAECKPAPVIKDCSSYGDGFWCGSHEEWELECQSKGQKYSSDCAKADGIAGGYCIRCSHCSDSDGGKNYYQRGEVETSGGVFADSCHDDSAGGVNANYLTEYYCKQDGTYMRESYVCPHGCLEGECIEESGTTHGQICTDQSQCSADLICKPSGRYGEDEKYCCYENECASVSSPTGNECVGEEGVEERIDPVPADLTCQNGEWVEEPQCTDSDDGDGYYVKGTVTGKFLGDSGEYTDYCSESNSVYVIEYYCSENSVLMSEFECPAGCADGACQEYIYKEHGEMCMNVNECDAAIGLLCKPSGRYGEQEMYCCYENECASVIPGTVSVTNCVGDGGADERDFPPPPITLNCHNGEWQEPEITNCSIREPGFWCGTLADFEGQCQLNGTKWDDTICYTTSGLEGNCMRCA